MAGGLDPVSEIFVIPPIKIFLKTAYIIISISHHFKKSGM
jgi:hypothetical protein